MTATGDIVVYRGWEYFCSCNKIGSGSVLLLVIDNIGELGVEVHIIKR